MKPFFLGNRRRAFTIVELVISSAIMIVLVGMAIGAMVYYLRQSSVLLSNARLTDEARAFEQELTMAAARCNAVAVQDSGNRLVLTLSDGTQRTFQFVNTDNNAATVRDNTVQEIGGGPGGTNQIWLRNVSRVSVSGTPQAIFTIPGGRRHVEVLLRLGDNDQNPNADCHRATGPGFQTYVLNTGVFPRNAL